MEGGGERDCRSWPQKSITRVEKGGTVREWDSLGVIIIKWTSGSALSFGTSRWGVFGGWPRFSFPSSSSQPPGVKSFRGRSSVTRVERKLKHEIKLRACVPRERTKRERERLKMMVVSSFSFSGGEKTKGGNERNGICRRFPTLWTMENIDILEISLF